MSRIMESKPHQIYAMFRAWWKLFYKFFVSRVVAKKCYGNPYKNFIEFFWKKIYKNFRHAIHKLFRYKSISVSSPDSPHNSKNPARRTVDYYWLASLNIINAWRPFWKPHFKPVSVYPVKLLLFSLLLPDLGELANTVRSQQAATQWLYLIY